MKRIFASAAILLTALNSPVSAMSGGPFDNGLQSASLDRGAIYQAILTFGNGSGFCYFSPTANIAANGFTAGGSTVLGGQAFTDTRGSITSRVVVYYKGLTYVGGAMGTTDVEARTVQCSMNANTNANQSQSSTGTSQSSTGFSTGSGSTASTAGAISQYILSNPNSFTMNGDFVARIYQTAPTLRFRGTGELSFIAPNQADAKAGLAFSGYSGLINAIVTSVGNANVGANFNANVFTLAELAIQNALAALPPLTTIQEALQAAEIRHLSVYGTRRYL